MKFKKKDLIRLIESYLFSEEKGKTLADIIKGYEEFPDKSQSLTGSDEAKNELENISQNKQIEDGERTKDEFEAEFGHLIRAIV